MCFLMFLCIQYNLEITLDGDEAEEKSRLIQQVFQLQNTLDGEYVSTFNFKILWMV